MPAEVVRCLLCRIRLLGWSICGKSFPSCLNHRHQGSHMRGGISNPSANPIVFNRKELK